jgi:DNA primase
VALFPQPFIDEVRSAADIVTVISDYVSLRKAGTSYKGLCPFHGEKTPSFNVNRDRGFFHCFGCGVGGDVFKFVELKEKVGFQDAVRQLAQRFGIPCPTSKPPRRARREPRARVAAEGCTKWPRRTSASSSRQPRPARIRDYLRQERGLTDDTITPAQLGAPRAGTPSVSGC